MSDWDNQMDSRVEYTPAIYRGRPRSASAGRLQRLSATYSSGSPLRRPLTASDWQSPPLIPRAPASRRVFSAIPMGSGSAPIGAWTTPENVLSDGSRRTTVQSLARNRRPEALADDVIQLKEQLIRAREDAKIAQVTARRLEADLLKSRSSLLKSEELIHNKERVMSPTVGISQLYRSPDTTHLVGNLKEQNRELRAARDALADELMSLRKSTRSTRVAELQSELFTNQMEMQRLMEINRVLNGRLGEAETSAQQALSNAREARRKLDEYMNGGPPPGEMPLMRLGANSGIAAGSIRKTLQAMHQAHKMLINQAALIRSVFPPGLDMADFQGRARQRSNTAGAPDVLNFLRNHVSKLNMELQGHPGAPQLEPIVPEPKKPDVVPKKATMAQLQDSIADLARKLRAMDTDRYVANADFQSNTEQMVDLMRLCVSEADRLQGVKTMPVVAAASPLASEPTPTPQAVVPPPAAAAVPTAPVSYTTLVKTSDVSGGAFDGTVFVVLQGDKGSSTEVTLPSDRYSFDTGEENEFEILAEDVGKVSSILLRMEVTDSDSTWHLNKIRLTSTEACGGSGLDTTFFLDDWVQPKSQVTLFPKADIGSVAEYEVTVYTTDSRGAGTDGKVEIKVVGDSGASDWIPLPAGDDCFVRGNVDTFNITGTDVNDLSNVALRLSGKDLHSGWFLQRVEVLHKGTGWKSVFYCNDWLLKSAPSVLLYEADTWMALTQYKLDVKTSDVKGAEFDGLAYVTFTGWWGDSKEVKLAKVGKTAHRFAQGSTESFLLMADDVGPISNITVRIEASNDVSDAWGLEKVDVDINNGSWYGGSFQYGNWLSMKLSSATIWKYRDVGVYQISIFTDATQDNAKFDGDVYIKLTGSYGTTDELLLVNDTTATSPPGQPKTLYSGDKHQDFSVEATDVGNLTSIQIRIDATGTTSTWCLDHINVTPPASVTNGDDSNPPAPPPNDAIFPFKSWLIPDNGFYTISKQLTKTDFKVRVMTNSSSNPFDGDVYITMNGLDGSSSEQRLVNGQQGNFLPSSVAEFTFNAEDAGQLSALSVRMESTGSCSWWYLDKIEVTNVSTGVTSYFRYSSWMNMWSSSITLSAQSLFEYKISVFTSVNDGGKFSSDLSVMIYGNFSSDWIKVPCDVGSYNSGAPATVIVKLSDIGTPYSVVVKAESAGGGQKSICLDRVEVANATVGADPFLFPTKDLLSQDESLYISRQDMLTHSATIIASGEDFNGTVYLALVCENGETDEVQLLKSDGTSPLFTVDSPTYIDFRTCKLGKVQKIKVRSVPAEKSRYLSLDRINMYSQIGDWDTFSYFCGKTVPEKFITLDKLENVQYIINVFTDDIRGNGTDADIYVSLVGDEGTSEWVMLNSDDGSDSESDSSSESEDSVFERGAFNQFTLNVTDVGVLSAIKVKMSAPYGSDVHSDWHLKKIQVLSTSSGEKYTFTHNDWITQVDVPVTISLASSRQIFQDYTIKVYGNNDNLIDEGYNARIKIYGDSGDDDSSGDSEDSSDTAGASSLMKLLLDQGVKEDGTNAVVFNARAINVGSFISIDFGMGKGDDDYGYMNCARVEVTNKATGTYGIFSIGQYMYSWNGTSNFQQDSPNTCYTVTVDTVALTQAINFDGEVYITIYGDVGTTEELQLSNWWTSSFQAGSTVDYYVTSFNVGVMSAISVRTVGSGSAKKWGLGSLGVTNNTTGGTAAFEWGKFVNAGTSIRIQKSDINVQYKLTVVTGDVRGANTDGEVQVMLSGSAGSSSDWITLYNDDTNFTRAATDTFTISSVEIGDNRQLRLRLVNKDGDSVHSSWYLSYIDVLNMSTGMKSTFQYNNWVGTDWWTQNYGVTIAESNSTQALNTYSVSITTGDSRGSDFNGEAFITFNGYNGSTDELKLVKPGFAKHSFDRAATEAFTVKGVDVGYIYSVTIRIVPTDDDPNWNLDKVEVTAPGSGDVATFNYGNWLDCDNTRTDVSRWRSNIEYLVVAHTSASVDASAFDGKSYITLEGNWGSTDEIELVNDAFSYTAGVPQSFNIKGSDVGSLQAASIRVEKSGAVSKWSLDNIEVTKVADSVTSNFNQKGDDGQKKSVVISDGDGAVTFPKDRPMMEYQVSIMTGDSSDAAYDGSAYLTIQGGDGDSDEILLQNDSTTNFGVGSTSVFKIKVPNYGNIRYLELRADFSGSSTTWQLSRVEMLNLTDNSKMLFNYNSYLNDWSSTAYLYPQSVYTCKVLVRTSDEPEASFDGRVFLTVATPWDNSGEMQLINDVARFDAGTVQEFTLKLPNISWCQNLVVRTEPGKGSNSQKWKLDWIQVQFPDCNSTYFAPCKAWIQKGDPDLSLSAMYINTYTVNLTLSSNSDSFDGTLYVTLVGDDGVEGLESKLDLGGDVLRAGDKRSFESVLLGSSSMSTVKVRAEATGSSSSVWLATLDLDGSVFSFDSPIKAPGVAIGTFLPFTTYEVNVYCGDVRGNGTDGDISVTLIGDKASTRDTRLWLNGDSQLTSGSISKGSICLPDVGNLTSLLLKLVNDSGSPNSQLHVSRIEVYNITSGMLTTFTVEGWLSQTGDCTTVTADDGSAVCKLVNYEISVYSAGGDAITAFDGEVQLKLEGPDGSDTGCISLGSGGADSGLFCPGALDLFMQRVRDVGAPTKLYGNVNTVGGGSSYALSRVEVVHTVTGEKATFKLGDNLYTWSWWREIPPLQYVDYQVSTNLSNTGAKDFDGLVYVTLIGEDGSTAESQLQPSWDGASIFQPGGRDMFYINGLDVGHLKQLIVRVDKGPSGATKKLSLEYADVCNTSSGIKGSFEYNNTINTGESVTINKTVVTVDYEVTITTGDVLGSGTDGQVYLSLSGDNGKADEVLVSSDPESFARGNSFVYTFKGLDVGDNRSLTLRLVAPEGGSLHSGWNLASVDVLNKVSGIKGTYNYYDWITMSNGGGSVTLSEAYNVQALNAYTVSVTTADQRDADFDGKAFITINGWDGRSTPELPLVDAGRSTAAFRRGQTSTFSLSSVDVGYVNSINIRMIPSATDPDWYLDTITVSNDGFGNSASFAFGDRLDTDTPSAFIYKTVPLTDFSVKVYTSDNLDAGFDGEVSVKLNGVNGSSDDIPLVSDDSSATFSPASSPEFRIRASDVGVVTSLGIKLKDSGKQKKWHLQKVELTNVSSSATSTFIYRDWVIVGADEISIPKDMPKVDWKVVVATGDSDDASFDGDVYITLNGAEGSSDEVKLDPTTLIAQPGAVGSGSNTYKPYGKSSLDAFAVKMADVGKIGYVQVRVEGSGNQTNWFLNRIEVTNTTSGALTVLNYKSSLNTNWNSTAYLYPQSSYTFKAQIYTADERGAGFDGDVYIKPITWWADGDELKLPLGDKAMERGSVVECTFTIPDISIITKMDVRIDPTGDSDSWQLDRIELTLQDQGYSTVYMYNDLLQAPNKSVATLNYQYLEDFEVTLYTSKESEPFDGTVYLTIVDDGVEDSKMKLLVKSLDPSMPAGSPPFMPGSKVVCSYKGANISNLTKATVSVEFSGTARRWSLDRMDLMSLTSYYPAPITFFIGTTFSTVMAGVTVTPLQSMDYDVIVNNSDVPGNGTDGDVYVTLTGLMGSSGELQLSQDNAFERAGKDIFNFSIMDLGELQSVQIRLADNGSVHSLWHLASVDVLHKPTGMQTSFPVGDWVQLDAPITANATTSRNIYIPYHVVVNTSDSSDASFDGRVSLTLKGESGQTSYKALLAQGGPGVFESGSCNEFTIKAVDVGSLSSILLDLEGVGSLNSWIIKQVEVTNTVTGDYGIFKNDEQRLCYWDGTTEITQVPKTATYTAMVVMKDQFLDGTSTFDGSIWVVLKGERGRTPELRLSNPYYDTTFDAGSSTTLSLSSYDIGALLSMDVRADNGDNATMLYLDRIEVTTDSNGSTSVFTCASVIKGGTSAINIPKVWSQAQYDLTVYTSDIRGAGTDADVYMTLSGDNGTADEIKLYNGPDNFKRAATDKFSFTTKDVGRNKRLSFRLDGEAHSGWALARIELLDKTPGIITVGYYNSWITQGGSAGIVFESSSYVALYDYTVTLNTGSDPKGGFNGSVFIRINGWYYGSSEELEVVPKGRTLAPGSSETFNLRFSDIGCPSSIDIRTDGDDGSRWQADQVVVTNVNSGYTSCFSVNEWFDASKNIGSYFRWTDNISYNVTVYTSTDQEAAGFDGDVYIVLTGMYGATDMKELVNGSSVLAPGSAEVFTLNARDVGALSKIELQVSPQKVASWKVDRVEVRNPSTGSNSVFPAGGAIIRDANTLIPFEKELQLSDFKVVVYTSNVSDGAFDGNVYLTLSGIEGNSSEVQLTNSSTNNFAVKGVDNFCIKAADVGALNCVTVRIDPVGSCTQWHLDKLEITPASTSATSIFSYRSYLNQLNPSASLSLTSVHDLQVVVKTSSKDQPDFDGDVYLALVGSYSGMDRVKLTGANEVFSQGSELSFSIKAPDMGSFTAVTVYMECTGAAKTWSLDSITVTDVTTGASPITFYLRDTLSDGSKTSATLQPASCYNYKAIIKTNDIVGAGVEGAQLFMSLLGSEGMYSEEVQLDLSAVGDNAAVPLAQGSVCAASFSALEFGSISAIKLRLDNDTEGQQRRWNLQCVELTNVDKGVFTLFYKADWIVGAAEVSSVRNVDYSITVDTTDIRGNGMDGRALLTIHGTRGSSREVELTDGSDTMFERGMTTQVIVNAPDLDVITAITIRLADPLYDTLHTGWHLARVVLLNPGTGRSHTFSHNAWLMGPDNLSVRLEDPSGGMVVQPPLGTEPIVPVADPVVPDPVEPEPVVSDPVVPDPVEPEPEEPETVVPDPVEPEPEEPETVVSDPVVPDPVEPEPEEPETVVQEAPKPRRPSFVPSEPFTEAGNDEDLASRLSASDAFDALSIRSDRPLAP